MSVGRFIVEAINGRWIKLTTGVLNWNPFLGDKFVSYDDYKDIKAENDRLSRIEDKYTNLCPVLNEQAGEIASLRGMLRSKYESEQNLVPMDHYAWTIGVEEALGISSALEPVSEHHVTDSIDGPEPEL